MTNIALVVLDTLRKDFFDEYFKWLPGRRFENAWSLAHYTVPAHASLFTGKYPRELGVNSKSEVLPLDIQTLPKELEKGGYTTRGISSNILVSPINNFDQGFKEFNYAGRAQVLYSNIYPWTEKAKMSDSSGAVRDAKLFLDFLMSDCQKYRSFKFGLKLKRNLFCSVEDIIKQVNKKNFGQKEFLFLNIMDIHAPYMPPDSYKTTKYTDEKISKEIYGVENIDDVAKEAYSNAVEYTSNKYKILFERLKEDFDIIITLSDHGELFGEYGSKKHYFGVYPELVNVPICISNTNSKINGEVEETVSLLDVHKTICELAGVEVESRGHNLLGDINDRKVLVESHGIRPSHVESLKKEGFDGDVLSLIDDRFQGIAMSSGYYAFKSPNGKIHQTGESDFSEPILELNRLNNNIKKESGINDGKNLSESVKNQLDELGYI